MTSLHPPSPVVGRPLLRFISGFSERLRQWRELSSAINDSVMTTSEAKDMGAIEMGSRSTSAGITVLALRGCLTDKGRSKDCSLVTVPEALLVGLSDLIFCFFPS